MHENMIVTYREIHTVKDKTLVGLKFGELPFKTGWQKKAWWIHCTANNEQYKNR